MAVLPTRPLGRTGMDVTAVGLGAWAIGGLGWEHAWGPQDDDDSVAAVVRAVEAGVNWVDTAPVYGHGHSEETVGAALCAIPPARRPYVFTKCGLLWDDADPMAAQIRDASRIRWELDGSQRRLGVDRVDLLQLHWPPERGIPLRNAWRVLVELRAEGRIRAAGLSNVSVAQLDALEPVGRVDTVQPPLSLLRRDAVAGVVPWCAGRGTGVIVYSPMESGLLSGAFTAARVAALPATDWRATAPEFTGDGLVRHLALVDRLRPVATRHGVPVAAVAVAWTLSWAGVTGAIVGARRPEQVDSWLPAAFPLLTGEDLDEVAAALRDTGSGTGPDRPAAAFDGDPRCAHT
jgi:aryl-alcohol dehydrogenase-like predicted oxidoreductase